MNNGIKIKEVQKVIKICEINTVKNYNKKA